MDLAGMKRRELQALCKRHGLPAGGTNADLVARLDAALSGTDGAAEEEEVAGVAARKGCLKQTSGDAAEAKKVTFVASGGKARRLRSRVIWSPIVTKARGKSAQAGTDSAAEDDSISAEVGADVPVRRSRRKSVSAAEAEEVGEAVAVERKRKRKNQENDESVAVSTQVGVSSRVTRRASLAGAAVVLPPAVEKKRGRGKATGGSNKLAAGSQDSEPDVQNSAQVEVSARVTRSRSIAPVVISPTVVEKKRRKTGDARTNVELPTVSDVPRNDAPVTRSLRNRVIQVNNSMVDETHTARQLENKTQPSRPSTCRHQQVSSSVEDKNQEQIAAPNKAPLLRCSGRNHSEDAEKQPEVKEPVKRSTRKSVVLATLEKVENDLIEEKKPEAHVRRSRRKSIVPVKDMNCIGEKIHNANSEDAVKQPATKGPVRGSRWKSVVSELHEKEKGIVTENNMEAHEGRSMRKPVMPVKDIKAVGKGIQNAKGKGVEKQFVVKQPTRRSSRKSVLPDMLENNSGLKAAQMNAEMNVRRSTRKSVLPNMLNEDNQDYSKMARKENFQSGKCEDDERQQKVKEPFRRSRRSVAAVPLEEQSNGLHEEKMSENPRRSTRKSVALNEVEKVSMDHTEIVARELERVGEEGLKLRKHRRSSLEISSSTNDSWRKQQNAEIPNEKGSTGGTQQASNSTTSKRRSSKRRRTTAPEVMSVKEANDDIIIMEATKDAHKANHEYKESSSRVQESGQVNATREELSPGPLLVTVTLTDEISTAQSVPVVIPGPESGDNANESSDKSKQDHSDIQAVDTHLSETSGELDQSSCIAGLVPHNCVVSEDKSLISKDHGEENPISGEGRVGLEANASESGEKNLADIMSTGLYPKSLQHDIDIIAEVTGKVAEESIQAADLGECPSRCSIGNPLSTSLHLEGADDDIILPVLNADKGCSSDGRTSSFGLELMFAEECKEIYFRNAEITAVEIDGGNKPSTSATPGFSVRSDCLQDEDVQLSECDADKKLDVDEGVAEEVLAQEKSSDHHVPAKTDLDMKINNEPVGPGTESGCSITEKNAGLVADNLDEQVIILVQQGDVQEGDLEKLSLISATPLPEKIGGGNKPSTPVKPDSYVGSDCLDNEDVQPTECDPDKKLDVYEGVADEVSTQDKSSDQHVPARTDLDMKINNGPVGPGTESGCSITEDNARLVADSLDEQVIILVQQGDVQEGDLEKLSLISATPLPEEIGGGNKPTTLVKPDSYVGSDCLEDEDVQPTECDPDKKLDADKGCSSDGRTSSFGLQLMFAEKCKEIYFRNAENTSAEIDGGNKPSTSATPGFYVRSDCLEDEDVQLSECDAHKKLDVEGVAEDVLAQEKSSDQHVPAKTDLNMKLNDEPVGPGMQSGCSIIEKNARLDANNIDGQAIILVQQGDGQEGDLGKLSLCSATTLPEEIGGGNKPSTLIAPDLYMGSDCQEDEDVQPTGFDADKRLDLDQGVTEDEVLAQQKSNDQHVPTKTDLNMKLNDELAGPCTESGCSITENNVRLFADNLDQQSIFQVQHGDVQEGDLKKPSPCSTTPECKPKCALPEETVLPRKNTGSISSAEQSPFGLESLFSQENIDESMGSATSHTKNGFDDSKDCHVKSALKNTHVSEPYSHDDTEEGISKNDVCMQTSQQDNGMEGLPEVNLDEERVLSVFSLDAKHMKEVINFVKVDCEGEGSEKLVHSEELKASSEKAKVNGLDGNEYDITDAVLNSALHTPANDKGSEKLHSEDLKASSEKIDVNGDGNAYGITAAVLSSALHTLANDICLGSNTDVLHQGHNDQCSDDTQGIIEDVPPKYIERGTVLLSGKERSNLKDGQLNSKFEGAQVVESGLYFNKNIGNILDTGSVVGEITPSGSGLSKDSSREYRQEISDGFSMETSLDGSSTCGEKIVCRVDAIENPSISVASAAYKHEGALSEEAARTMKNYAVTCSSNPRELVMELQSLFSKGNTKESDPHDGLAFPSAENSGYESINVEQQDELIGCSSTVVLHQGHNHKDRSNVDRVEQVTSEPCTNDIVEAAAKCIESGLVLPPSEEKSNLNDGQLDHKLESPNSMVSGLNCDKYVCNTSDNRSIAVIVGKRTASGSGLPQDYRNASGVAGIGNASSSLATPDPECKCEGSLSEDVVCRMKIYTGTSSVDPRHLLMDLQSLYSEGSTEKSGLQDNLAYPSAESRRDEPVVWHVEELLDTHVSSEVLHQDHKECNKPNEGKFSPKALVENNMTKDAPIEEMGISMMVPLVGGMSEIPDEQLNTKMSVESEELSFSCDNDTSEKFCTAAAKREVPEVLSSPKSPEESAKFQCVTVSRPGPCQQRVNESTSVQATYNNQDHEEYNQNNEDQTTPGISSSSVPEAVEIEQSEMEIGLIPAAEASVLPVPDKQLNNKLEGNEVGHNCSYDKDSSSLFDTDFMNREASNLHKDHCMDLPTEDNHPYDLPAPRSPEQPAYCQNNNDSGSVGGCQSSRCDIDEIRAKLQSFKVSSTVKGSYITMSTPRSKPGDSMSQSAMALLRNIENTPAVKASHPVKPKADGKDSLRRALQPISGRPREH